MTAQKDIIRKDMVKVILENGHLITESSDAARELFNTHNYGAQFQKQKVQLSFFDSLFLLEKGKIEIVDGRNKEFSIESFTRKAKKSEKNFWIKYCVYKDFRERGYIIKTALKFGAEFRVYDRGIKPGEDHAKWVVFPVAENMHLTWYEFSAKNRVAHSTKKRLLIAIVDEENDITYYEVKWTRP